MVSRDLSERLSEKTKIACSYHAHHTIQNREKMRFNENAFRKMGTLSLWDVDYDVDYNHPAESSMFGIRTFQPL